MAPAAIAAIASVASNVIQAFSKNKGSSESSGSSGSGILGTIGGLASGFGGLVSSLFGPSVKSQIKWQKEAQMELNQQAAELNYTYGEKSAENAYNRQMAMYERSYEDQSYKAMRNQMEDAGLSVGLMYGNGASGGGAGQMSGAPQGETGGAIAGDASAGIALALEAEKIRMQQQLVNAEVNLKGAQAKEAEAQTEKTSEEAATERAVRAVRAELMKQQGMQTWISNVHQKWQDMQYLYNEDGEVEDYVTEHQLYGTYAILGKSLSNQTAIAAAVNETLKSQGLAAANDKTREETKKVVQDIITGAAEAALKRALALEADARKHQIGLETGEETNWKTWLEIGFRSVDTLCKVANTAGNLVGFTKIAKFLKGQAKRTSGGTIPRQYEEVLDNMTSVLGD